MKLGIGTIALIIFGALFCFGSFYFVPEGHVGVEKRFGKAVAQTEPGLNFKVPLIDSVHEMEVRERKSVEELQASTKNQLRIATVVSVNWTVNRESAIDLFRNYGSLEQFENRVLDPQLRSATKTALAIYPADELIKNRSAAISSILEELKRNTEHLPITISSPQIENIAFPSKYTTAILEKESAREAAVAENHRLAKQKLQAQQAVNTAESNRDAAKAQADGLAYATRTAADAKAYASLERAKAEAKGIKLINEQIAANPKYVEFIKAKNWDGKLPSTVLGESSNLMMTMRN